jgi:hypothetical protein
MITRRSLLTGLAVSALIVPTGKIVRATEAALPIEKGQYVFTSSWLEGIGRGVWRQKSYRFMATAAPKILVINAAPDVDAVAGVQLDGAPILDRRSEPGFDFIVKHAPLVETLGWIRGAVDVTNKRGVEIELTDDEERSLLQRQSATHMIVKASPSDLFCLADGEGSFVLD